MSTERGWKNNPHKILFSNGDVISDYGRDGTFDFADCIIHLSTYKPSVDCLPQSRIMLTADTHNGHRYVASLRGFGRTDEGLQRHRQWLIDNITATVKPDCFLVILGDVTMNNLVHLSFLDEIPCLGKALIAGNHDRVSTMFDRGRSVEEYLRYFDFIVTKGSIGDFGSMSVLAHVPPIMSDHTTFNYPRFADKRLEAGPYAGGENDLVIHGHVHNQWRRNGGCLNVGIDVMPHPISLADAIKELTKETQDDDMCAIGDLKVRDML